MPDESDHKNSYGDGYADAIPMEKLMKKAHDHILETGANCKDSIRECATKIVQENVCPCLAEAQPIVNAVVDEYIKQTKIVS